MSDDPSPRVLLLATTTGYQTRSFGKAAERLGVELVFATDCCHQLDDPWRDSAIPVRFHDERGSTDAILHTVDRRPIHGVLALGDRPTVLAALTSHALGLPGNTPAAAEAARDKRRTRECLAAGGLPAPWFFAVPLGTDAGQAVARARFPCVVKPLGLSASRGVIRADDPEQFIAAFERLRRLLLTTEVRALRDPVNDHILVEGYIDGPEYAVEGVLEHGRLRMLAVFDKPDPLTGPYFEETIYVTPSSLDAARQHQLEEAIAQAARALGLWHGPIHAECRYACAADPDVLSLAPRAGGPPVPETAGGRLSGEVEVCVLELAARPIGGLCARALRFTRAAGQTMSYEELLLLHALGEPVERYARESQASGVMMVPIPRRGIFRGVQGVDAGLAIAGVEEIRITAKPDQVLVPLPEGASYLGFIFARGASPAAVVTALRRAHARLQITIDSAVKMIATG